MGDVDDGAAGIGLGADHGQHAVGEVGGQCGGHLVEHEDLGRGGEGGGEIEDAQGRERQVARAGGKVEARDAEPVGPVQESLARGGAQAQVAGDVEVGDERGFLIDRHQARAPGRAGRGEAAGRAEDADLARIGAERAGQDLDEGGLARAVGAHERHDLALAHAQGGVAQRLHRAEAAGDAGGVEHDVHPRRPRGAALAAGREGAVIGGGSSIAKAVGPRRHDLPGAGRGSGDHSPGPLQAMIWSIV